MGFYGLDGWGSYDKVNCCFVWKYAQKMLVFREFPFWSSHDHRFWSPTCGLLQRRHDHSPPKACFYLRSPTLGWLITQINFCYRCAIHAPWQYISKLMNITCNRVSLSMPQSNELESKCSLIHDKWVCHNFFETLLDTIVLDQCKASTSTTSCVTCRPFSNGCQINWCTKLRICCNS